MEAGKTWVVVHRSKHTGVTVFGPFEDDHKAEVWVDDVEQPLVLAGNIGTWHITPLEEPDISGWVPS